MGPMKNSQIHEGSWELEPMAEMENPVGRKQGSSGSVFKETLPGPQESSQRQGKRILGWKRS